ncbi:unnamed protein product [Bursaphelenchus okinawaensis]|uniref:Aquaporin n=1 Tax=Bursaphelenchus okinawaensis TaxID=465554 RepID=A0A811L8S6_9BILA|nr:unnamed protein product [Bursaphelenchus okinawaensis]CAG9119643.1 unnamed protein product [Bursaphelenchus okinawaensis]
MLTGPLRTAQIFAGYPSVHQSSVNAFIAEVTASFVFAFFISTVRKRHSHVIVNKVVQSIALALTLMSLDFNSTTTLNPAREIGSRAASFLFGYDEKVFSYRSSKWLVIVTIGPLIGATVSAWLCSWLSHCGNSKKVRNVSDKTCQTQPHLYGVHFDNLDSRML